MITAGRTTLVCLPISLHFLELCIPSRGVRPRQNEHWFSRVELATPLRIAARTDSKSVRRSLGGAVSMSRGRCNRFLPVLESVSAATNLDLISYLKAIPVARMRRDVRIPSW